MSETPELTITHEELVQALVKPGRELFKMMPGALELMATNAALKIQFLVGRLAADAFLYKDGGLPRLDSALECHKYHMVLGMAGEVGELLDCLKKLVYNKVLDLDNLVEELGDFEFYYKGFCFVERTEEQILPIEQHSLKLIKGWFQVIKNCYGITQTQLEQANIQKLSKRYQQLTYSDEAAQIRADKEPIPLDADELEQIISELELAANNGEPS